MWYRLQSQLKQEHLHLYEEFLDYYLENCLKHSSNKLISTYLFTFKVISADVTTLVGIRYDIEMNLFSRFGSTLYVAEIADVLGYKCHRRGSS